VSGGIVQVHGTLPVEPPDTTVATGLMVEFALEG
jgi:hypothetical protein